MCASFNDEVIEIDLVENDSPASADPANVYLSNLLETLFEERYIELLDSLSRALEEMSSTQELGVLLGAAAYLPTVPVQVYAKVLAIDPRVAFFVDAGLRAPLHMISIHRDRPDIVRTIVGVAPDVVHLRDMEGLRPIDIMTQKILMKEERFRYLGSRRSPEDSQLLEDAWECARFIVKAHAREQIDRPMLHTCLLASGDVPLALIERALRRYRDQLPLADEEGNLPLHLVAGRLPPEDADDLLGEVLNKYPEAAERKNHADQRPFDCAIEANRHWDTGVGLLLNSLPAALESLNLSTNVLSIIFEELYRRGHPGIVYTMLRTDPDLFFRA